MNRTVVLDIVGLTAEFLDSRMPRLAEWAAKRRVSTISPALPAVTCTAQATFYTGELPAQHGIVGNGWYFRDDYEIHFWRQSNRLVQAPKLRDVARRHDPQFTFANLFGWFNMYSTADISITPRPMYPADGRKLPDVYTEPPALRTESSKNSARFRCSSSRGAAYSYQFNALDCGVSETRRGTISSHADLRLSAASRLQSSAGWAGRSGDCR
jgi:predicted AlkP superfamily pyrophosphatase or phosphodiesterase